MEAGKFIRPHQKAAMADTAEHAKRLGPHITAYSKKLGELSIPSGLRIGLKAPVEDGWEELEPTPAPPPAQSIDLEDWLECDIDEVPMSERWHISQTDGVPVPRGPGDFLADDPPYGDPL